MHRSRTLARKGGRPFMWVHLAPSAHPLPLPSSFFCFFFLFLSFFLFFLEERKNLNELTGFGANNPVRCRWRPRRPLRGSPESRRRQERPCLRGPNRNRLVSLMNHFFHLLILSSI